MLATWPPALPSSSETAAGVSRCADMLYDVTIDDAETTNRNGCGETMNETGTRTGDVTSPRRRTMMRPRRVTRRGSTTLDENDAQACDSSKAEVVNANSKCEFFQMSGRLSDVPSGRSRAVRDRTLS